MSHEASHRQVVCVVAAAGHRRMRHVKGGPYVRPRAIPLALLARSKRAPSGAPSRRTHTLGQPNPASATKVGRSALVSASPSPSQLPSH